MIRASLCTGSVKGYKLIPIRSMDMIPAFENPKSKEKSRFACEDIRW